MIFPCVSDTFFPPNVDPCHDDSDDKDITVIVVGGTAFVKAWIENFKMEGSDEVKGEMEEDGDDTTRHCRSPFCSTCCKFNHMRAKVAIYEDYFYFDSLYGPEFKSILNISLTQFEHIITSIMDHHKLDFYQDLRGSKGKTRWCLKGMPLYPIKILAFGVPYSAFVYYFPISVQFGMNLCREFDWAIKVIYLHEYLRIPNDVDYKRINKLYCKVHSVDGMLGSLDCTHTIWKNCPKAWVESYKGKENTPSIVLEGISYYHMFFWHASYGYASTLNDKTIFELSPFQQCLLDGSFKDNEKSAGLVPFKILGMEFSRMFVLVDGIYMKFSRFVKGIKD